MSAGAYKNRIPRHIEPRRFAQQQVQLAGDVAVENLTRLSRAVNQVVELKLDLQFEILEEPRTLKVVRGQASAQVLMQCQRCLNDVLLSLQCDVHAALVWSESEAESLPEHLDPWIVEDEEADLHQLVEDEVLLNLPYVALHDYDCVDPSVFRSGPEQSQGEAEPRESPFKVLAQLKNKTEK